MSRISKSSTGHNLHPTAEVKLHLNWKRSLKVESTEIWCLIKNTSQDNRGVKTLLCDTAWHQPRSHVSLMVFHLLKSHETQGEIKFNAWLDRSWNTEILKVLIHCQHQRTKINSWFVCFFLVKKLTESSETFSVSELLQTTQSAECLQTDPTETRELNTVQFKNHHQCRRGRTW